MIRPTSAFIFSGGGLRSLSQRTIPLGFYPSLPQLSMAEEEISPDSIPISLMNSKGSDKGKNPMMMSALQLQRGVRSKVYYIIAKGRFYVPYIARREFYYGLYCLPGYCESFSHTIDKILQRLVAEDIYNTWTKYMIFAIYVVGISWRESLGSGKVHHTASAGGHDPRTYLRPMGP